MNEFLNSDIEDPILTVYCTVYNHAQYLEDAIQGFLIQETEYKFQVFFFDDASTDGSSEILRRYGALYPELFKVYISPQNIYNLPERMSILKGVEDKYLKGKYIAMCEGDDFWTDKNKLQLQIDYLEKNPDVVMCCHSSVWWDLFKSEEKVFELYSSDCDIPPEEIIAPPRKIPRTSSFVLYKEVYEQALYGIFPKTNCGDYPILLSAIRMGRIHYFAKNMSTYRFGTEGSWSAVNLTSNRFFLQSVYTNIHFFVESTNCFDGKYVEAFRERLNSYLYYSAWHERNIPVDEWDELAREVIQEIGEEPYSVYTDRLRLVHRIFNSGEGLSKDEIDILRDAENIVVFGTGDYSTGVLKLIDKNNCRYKLNGFLESKPSRTRYMDLPVWSVNGYEGDKNRTIVVVGVGPMLKAEVSRILDKCEYCYIAPYWKDYWGNK